MSMSFQKKLAYASDLSSIASDITSGCCSSVDIAWKLGEAVVCIREDSEEKTGNQIRYDIPRDLKKMANTVLNLAEKTFSAEKFTDDYTQYIVDCRFKEDGEFVSLKLYPTHW